MDNGQKQKSEYPQFFRKGQRAILRGSDTTGVIVEIPDNPNDRLPVMMIKAQSVYPTKERFDEAVSDMEPINEELYNDYIKTFCGRVEHGINRPMQEKSIQIELLKIKNFNSLK